MDEMRAEFSKNITINIYRFDNNSQSLIKLLDKQYIPK